MVGMTTVQCLQHHANDHRRDQELRFTVHESPDYYQLKVSVFNDDKKTDMIGETFVDLKNVVVPGGGQSDIWHNLNYRGKYAGDIRIEMTYYDSRPKDDAVVERRRDSEKIDVNSEFVTGNGLAGPRQPKPVKRRPLPAGPTEPPQRPVMPDHAQSAPTTFTSQRGPLPRNGYPDHGNYASSPYADIDIDQSRSPYIQPGTPQSQPDLGPGVSPNPRFYTPPQDERRNSAQAYLPSQLHQGSQQNTPSTYSPSRILPQQIPVPDSGLDRYSESQDRYGSSPSKADLYRESPLRQSMSHQAPNHPYTSPAIDDDGPPPPPPAHRSSGSLPLHHTRSRVNMAPTAAPIPVPMNSNYPPRERPDPYSRRSPATVSPSTEQSYQYPAVSSQTSYSERSRGYSEDLAGTTPPTYTGAAMPPSLVPGFDPTIAEDESERIMYENEMNSRFNGSQLRRHSPQPQPNYEEEPPLRNDPRPQSMYDRPPRSAYIGTPESIYERSPQTFDRRPPNNDRQNLYNDNAPAQIHQTPPRQPYDHRSSISTYNASPIPPNPQRVHRTSAPITPMVKPRAVSPDPRGVPPRKSVSPRPGPAPVEERRLSGVPFGPDSYDELNPGARSAEVGPQPRIPFETPAQAKEAARQHEVEKLRDQGPIIGNDGREIDPSDHLPADTWAPEPERKQNKRPEVVVRFRNAPQGAQPMPATARRTPREQRPTSIAGPIYSQEQDSPAARAGRNRLQKSPRAMPQPAHAQSSPIVPTTNTNTNINTPPNPPRGYPRASASDYALREHENYGYNDSSPSYRGMSGGPPPIPAKVPIQAGNQNYGSGGMNALSEEIRSIDIGMGYGGGGGGSAGRVRRSRYGP